MCCEFVYCFVSFIIYFKYLENSEIKSCSLSLSLSLSPYIHTYIYRNKRQKKSNADTVQTQTNASVTARIHERTRGQTFHTDRRHKLSRSISQIKFYEVTKRIICDLALVVEHASILCDDGEVLFGEVNGWLEILHPDSHQNCIQNLTGLKRSKKAAPAGADRWWTRCCWGPLSRQHPATGQMHRY